MHYLLSDSTALLFLVQFVFPSSCLFTSISFSFVEFPDGDARCLSVILHSLVFYLCVLTLLSSDLFNHVYDLCLCSYQGVYFLSRYVKLFSIFVCSKSVVTVVYVCSAASRRGDEPVTRITCTTHPTSRLRRRAKKAAMTTARSTALAVPAATARRPAEFASSTRNHQGRSLAAKPRCAAR